MLTREEAAKIVYSLKTVYPIAYKRFSVELFNRSIMVWQSVMSDYTYAQVSTALETYIAQDTKGFPPSPGQVIEIIHSLKSGDDITPLEAWNMVRRALRNSTYNSQEEFDKLPRAVQRAIGTPANLKEMARMDESTVESVEQSHFIRQYNVELAKQKADRKIPSKVVSIMEQRKKKIQQNETDALTDKSELPFS